MFSKLYTFVKCLMDKNLIKGVKGLYDTVTGMIELIPLLSTPVGWIKLVVNLVCGWEDLKNGINALTSGISESDRLKKFNYYGKFAGFFFKAIAG